MILTLVLTASGFFVMEVAVSPYGNRAIFLFDFEKRDEDPVFLQVFQLQRVHAFKQWFDVLVLFFVINVTINFFVGF